MNWDDPAARAALIERVGPKEYNRLVDQHFKDSTITIINGYGIRIVNTRRFGRIYMVDGALSGFKTQEQAEAHARTLAPKEPTA